MGNITIYINNKNEAGLKKLQQMIGTINYRPNNIINKAIEEFLHTYGIVEE